MDLINFCLEYINTDDVIGYCLDLMNKIRWILIKGVTSRYFELFFGSLKIVVNWKENFK